MTYVKLRKGWRMRQPGKLTRSKIESGRARWEAVILPLECLNNDILAYVESSLKQKIIILVPNPHYQDCILEIPTVSIDTRRRWFIFLDMF